MRLNSLVKRFLPELALALFCTLNLLWVAFWQGVEAFPVHFIFISVSVVYGLRMWTTRYSALVIMAVSLPCFALMVRQIALGKESHAELAEVPLMALLFVVVVWHVRKRQRAVEDEHALFDNASHELLTPLTIARGELELLGRDGIAPTIEELTETRRVVLEELQRSEVLAAGLLALSRLDGACDADRHLVATDDLIDAAVQRWRRVTNRPLLVATHAHGELSCVRQHIARLLDNLIENALRHTPDGASVTLTAWARGHRFVLEVSDQGAGIPDDALPYIFDRFYRARTSDDSGGSGLGLAIVRAIAESHGGSVDVESTVGLGTTFRVELPGFERQTDDRLLPIPA